MVILGCLFSVSVVAGCVEHPQPPRDIQERQFHLPPVRPSNLTELLTNIHYAIEHGLLTKRALYEGDNFLVFTGATGVTGKVESSTTVSGWATGLRRIAPMVVIARIATESLSLNFVWRAEKGNEIEAWLRLAVLAPQLITFEHIVGVFGSAWKYPSPLEPPPSPHQIFMPPTHPQGNRTIIYEFHNGRMTQSVRISFGADGSLDFLNVRAQERN